MAAKASSLPLILAIDIGTSTVKAARVDGDGQVLGTAREYVLDHPREVSVWNRDRRHGAIERVLGGVGPLSEVDAVVVSGHGPTIVPVDREGNALEPVLVWNDGRERRITGDPSFFLPKAAWLMHEEPDVYEQCRYLLSLPEYMDFLLTGVPVTITPNDAFIPYIWNSESISAYGLDPDRFPPFVRSGERIGFVRDDAAHGFGLPVGIPVIAGGSDFLMSLVGTASLAPGRTCDRAGTSEGINFCSTEPVATPHLRTLPHVREGLYNVAAILESTGSAFEWLRVVTGQQEKGYVEILEDIQAVGGPAGGRPGIAGPGGSTGRGGGGPGGSAGPGGGGVSADVPGVGAPLFFPSIDEREGWNFADGAFLHLNPGHGKAELGRAVVESLGFAVRHSLELLSGAGCDVEALRVGGGQAKNRVWNKMKADIGGHEILVPAVVDAELVGNACCGMVGIGACSDLFEASERMVKIRERISPDPKVFEFYGERYEHYREEARHLKGLEGLKGLKS